MSDIKRTVDIDGQTYRVRQVTRAQFHADGGADYRIEADDGTVIGHFSLVRSNAGWDSFSDGKSSPLAANIAASFAAEVQAGKIAIDQ